MTTNVNNQSSGVVIPAIAAGTGAALGATVLAPNKYKSLGDLVDAANKDDKFVSTVLKAPEKASDEVAAAYNDVSKTMQEVLSGAKSEIDSLFGDAKEVKWQKVLDVADDMSLESFKDSVNKVNTFFSDFSVEKLANGIEVGDDTLKALSVNKLSIDDMGLSLVKNSDGKSVLVMKNLKELMATAAKEGADDVEKQAVDIAKAKLKELGSGIDMIKTGVENRLKLFKLIDSGGNVTRANYEKFLTKDLKCLLNSTFFEEIAKQFDTIKKNLGKSRYLGAIVGGASALIAGLGVNAMVNNKKA